MKKLSLLLIVILIYLTSCNTSAPSTYISSADDNTTHFYNVTFETNGGTKVAPTRVISGSILTVPFEPKKEGTTFNGWYVDKELTIPYKFGEIVEGDMTLYARWVQYFIVKFDTLGGTKIDDVRVTEGFNLAAPVQPIKQGFTFNGWYVDKEYKEPYNFSAIVTSNLVLYAYWI